MQKPQKFLEENPFLVLDTKFFSAEFKHKLVESMENVDEDCNGLLINSENFQALELLQEKYREAVKCVYIDPPYNAKSSEILYKNTFKHAAWLSLMCNRLQLANNLIKDNGGEVVAIDEVEQTKLGELLQTLTPEKNVLPVTVVHNPSGQQGDNFSFVNEFAYFVYPNTKGIIGLEDRPESEWDTRTFRDNSGNSNLRTDAANCFYPIFVKDKKIVGFGEVCDDNFHPIGRNVIQTDGIIAVYPIDNNKIEKKWVFERGTVESIIDELWIKEIPDGIDVMRTKKKFRHKTTWTDKRFSANSYGSALLTAMDIKFSYPKSIFNVLECVNAGCSDKPKGLVLDFFGGSGTTAHAVILQNYINNYARKYVLVEMGFYFEDSTKARIEKSIYSPDPKSWKKGKPVSRKGISQCFKYLRLEQYEDTLNNLQPKQKALDFVGDKGDFNEAYLLSYMLDTETKGDLFNLEWFVHPFSMTLKTTKDNELIDTPVDMVETFNYLIGLNVETLRWPKDGYCVVEGTTHIGNERTLVIWRDCEKVSNEALNEFFRKQAYSTTDSEFDKIYVNGDNTLPNIKTDEEHWKVVLIEEEFKKRMFS